MQLYSNQLDREKVHRGGFAIHDSSPAPGQARHGEDLLSLRDEMRAIVSARKGSSPVTFGILLHLTCVGHPAADEILYIGVLWRDSVDSSRLTFRILRHLRLEAVVPCVSDNIPILKQEKSSKAHMTKAKKPTQRGSRRFVNRSVDHHAF